MDKLKKISIVLIIIMLLGCMFINKTYATLSCNVSLSTPKKDLVQGEEISVYVQISNLQTTKGIIAIGALLEYDTKSLTLIDIEGQNKWSEPFYSTSSGKITSFKNALSKNNENVLKINFKAKDNITGESWINIKDFEISDGDSEANVGSDKINIRIASKNNNVPEEDKKPSEDKPNDNTQSSGNSTNNNGNKPSTGTTSKPSGTTNKENTSNKNTTKEETNTTENIVEENTETNTIQNTVDENLEQNNNVQNIFAQEEQEETITKKQDNKKGLIYAACIFGAISIVIVTFYIIKYLKVSKKEK